MNVAKWVDRMDTLLLASIALILIFTPHVVEAVPHSLTAELVVDAASKRAEFRVHGLDPGALARLAVEAQTPEAWRHRVSISVGSGKAPASPMLGSYRVSGRDLVFVPRFPPDRSISSYLVEIDPSLISPSDGAAKVRIVVEPKFAPVQKGSDRQATTVEAVYPSRAMLPENLLKFYIVFSTPMARGGAYDHIELLDGAGRRIADPFLELGEELWSVDCKRFTLFFDPGRIKQGLRPRMEAGPVLEAGKGYTLVIRPTWTDARGMPLGREFRKAFQVGPVDETVPDPRRWTIRAPRAGSRDPLVIRSPEPLDRANFIRMIGILDPGGESVYGAVRVESEETVWTLTPDAPWRLGGYRACVAAELEDLGGNSVGGRFEVDLVEPITPTLQSSTLSIPFRIER